MLAINGRKRLIEGSFPDVWNCCSCWFWIPNIFALLFKKILKNIHHVTWTKDPDGGEWKW